jgi:Arc/MetJ-type ribon-helix-helix transcriptional regulator
VKEAQQFKGQGLGTTHKTKPICVKLPPELDEFIRGLPNRSEWLREAIEEKKQRGK